MKISLKTSNCNTLIKLINNEPDWAGFTEPTLSILQLAYSDGDYEIIPDPEPYTEPIAPDYLLFNMAISFNVNMIGYEIIANNNHPSIVSKKDLAYSMITDHGIDNFASIFPIFCQLAGVTQIHRDEWAALALFYNLPTDFIDVVKGV
jgi:hypothetical protein